MTDHPAAGRLGCLPARLGSGDYEGIMAQLFLLLLPVFMGDTIVLCEAAIRKKCCGSCRAKCDLHGRDVGLLSQRPDLSAGGSTGDSQSLQLCVTGGLPETWYEAFLERFGVDPARLRRDERRPASLVPRARRPRAQQVGDRYEWCLARRIIRRSAKAKSSFPRPA
jgi:hypothetical protein